MCPSRRHWMETAGAETMPRTPVTDDLGWASSTADEHRTKVLRTWFETRTVRWVLSSLVLKTNTPTVDSLGRNWYTAVFWKHRGAQLANRGWFTPYQMCINMETSGYRRFWPPKTLLFISYQHVTSHNRIVCIHPKKTQIILSKQHWQNIVGRDIVVGVATRYGLDGTGIQSRWGRNFPHPSKPPLGPTQPSFYNGAGLSRG